MKKIDILVLLRHYLPGYKYGGPIRSVSNLVEYLGNEYNFRIATSDRDLNDGEQYPGICVDGWNKVGNAWVYYGSERCKTMNSWIRLINGTSCDVVYMNSLFDPEYTLLVLVLKRIGLIKDKKILLAPRGELSPGALGLKWWKKCSFLAFAKFFGLYRDVLWHATTEQEAKLIYGQFGAASKVIVAENITSIPESYSLLVDREGGSSVLRIVFLSRLSRKKNLGFALEVLTKCKINIVFDIWGAIEDNQYWSECDKLIRSVPEHVKITYRGGVENSQVSKILCNYHLFFLPTLGENFGHAIAESLLVGTPVLISNRTPWRNLHDLGVGWDLPIEHGAEAFLMALEEAKRKVDADNYLWRTRVREFAVDHFTSCTAVEDSRQMFLAASEMKD